VNIQLWAGALADPTDTKINIDKHTWASFRSRVMAGTSIWAELLQALARSSNFWTRTAWKAFAMAVNAAKRGADLCLRIGQTHYLWIEYFIPIDSNSMLGTKAF